MYYVKYIINYILYIFRIEPLYYHRRRIKTTNTQYLIICIGTPSCYKSSLLSQNLINVTNCARHPYACLVLSTCRTSKEPPESCTIPLFFILNCFFTPELYLYVWDPGENRVPSILHRVDQLSCFWEFLNWLMWHVLRGHVKITCSNSEFF